MRTSSFVGFSKLILFVSLGFVRCSADLQTGDQSGVKDAVVSRDQAKRADEIVKVARRYLPYDEWGDGCFARALYLQAELALEGIPTRAAFIRMPPPVNPDPKKETWNYHVTPSFEINEGEKRRRMVLDPLHDDKGGSGLIPLETWAQAYSSGAKVRELRSGEAPPIAANEFILSVAGHSFLKFENVAGQKIFTTAEMHAIPPELLLEAYKWAYLYNLIRYAHPERGGGPISAKDISVRLNMLIARTLVLGKGLTEKVLAETARQFEEVATKEGRLRMSAAQRQELDKYLKAQPRPDGPGGNGSVRPDNPAPPAPPVRRTKCNYYGTPYDEGTILAGNPRTICRGGEWVPMN